MFLVRYAVEHSDLPDPYADVRLGVFLPDNEQIVDLLSADPRLPLHIEGVMHDPVRWLSEIEAAITTPRYCFDLADIHLLHPFSQQTNLAILEPSLENAPSLRYLPWQLLRSPHQLECDLLQGKTPIFYQGYWRVSSTSADFSLRTAALVFQDSHGQEIAVLPVSYVFLSLPDTKPSSHTFNLQSPIGIHTINWDLTKSLPDLSATGVILATEV